jgi:hypothetical protein
MRYRKARTALHWISTFLNVTLHCCTPAHAENIHGLSVVATGLTTTRASTIGSAGPDTVESGKLLSVVGRQGCPGVDREQYLYPGPPFLLRSYVMGHAATANFGIFPAGRRVEVGGYDLCREVACAGRIAVFHQGANEPVAYLALGVKSSFEALVWLDGFRSGYRHGSDVGRQTYLSGLQGFAARDSMQDRRGCS